MIKNLIYCTICFLIISCNQLEQKPKFEEIYKESRTSVDESLKQITEEAAKQLRQEAVDNTLNTSIINPNKYKSNPYIYKHLKKLKTVYSIPDFLKKYFE